MESGTFPVSRKAPFLSNLNVLDNIKLINDNVQHFSKTSSEALVLEKLKSLGLNELARVHHSTLSDIEMFLMQLIRACIKNNHAMIIDSPFLMVPTQKDVTFLLDAISMLDLECEDILVIDISSQAHKYKEEFCHIEEC